MNASINARAWVIAGAVAGVALALSVERSRTAIVEAAASVTDALRDLLEGFEGYREHVYDANPPNGDWTIGIGHKVKPGEEFFPYGDVKQIDRARAEALFEADSAEAREAVRDYVMVPLSDVQRAALESLVFNIGARAFRESTLLRLLNQGDYAAAADQFDRWVYAGGVRLAGLASRRESEKEIFLS